MSPAMVCSLTSWLLPSLSATNGSASGPEQLDDEEPPLNRASRRAQQRDDAQAGRPQHPRR